MLIRVAALMCFVFGSVASLHAQYVPSLSKLVQAKITNNEEGPKLILMLEAYRTEEKKGTHHITKMRMEQRTRTVTNAEGKEIEQIYSVAVPYVESVENPTISVSAGIKPQSFDATEFFFFDLKGNAVDVTDAAKTLDKLRAVFLLDNARRMKVDPLPKLALEVLNQDCLMIVCDKPIRKRPQSMRVRPAAAAK